VVLCFVFVLFGLWYASRGVWGEVGEDGGVFALGVAWLWGGGGFGWRGGGGGGGGTYTWVCLCTGGEDDLEAETNSMKVGLVYHLQSVPHPTTSDECRQNCCHAISHCLKLNSTRSTASIYARKSTFNLRAQ